jgi:hypothetical protein
MDRTPAQLSLNKINFYRSYHSPYDRGSIRNFRIWTKNETEDFTNLLAKSVPVDI